MVYLRLVRVSGGPIVGVGTGRWQWRRKALVKVFFGHILLSIPSDDGGILLRYLS